MATFLKQEKTNMVSLNRKKLIKIGLLKFSRGSHFHLWSY